MLPTFDDIHHLISTFGYLAIFLIIAGESMGIPLPGETTLVSAAIYAGVTHRLNPVYIILAAFLGAVVGDNIGFLIGKVGGYRLLRRFGKYIKLDESKLKVGQYLFMLHGGKIVFIGRFFSLLRTWAAFLAGVNKMHWKKFLFFNAAGGFVWASFYGSFGFLLGRHFSEFSRTVRISFFIIGTLFVIFTTIYLYYNLKALEKKAEKALPGPLK
jgi:membrane protein DedA with SNARE-associated domain